jgi:quercetin dioxygenase-like cupin family protein
MKRAVALVALLSLIVPTVIHRFAWATPSTGVSSTILGRGTIAPFHSQTRSGDFTVTQRKPAEVVMAQITLAVGGNTGWHIHHGPVFAFVKAGHLAVTRMEGVHACVTQTYGPGQAFVENPDMIHIGRNAGTVPVVLVATYTNVPVGSAPAMSVAAPAGCH